MEDEINKQLKAMTEAVNSLNESLRIQAQMIRMSERRCMAALQELLYRIDSEGYRQTEDLRRDWNL